MCNTISVTDKQSRERLIDSPGGVIVKMSFVDADIRSQTSKIPLPKVRFTLKTGHSAKLGFKGR